MRPDNAKMVIAPLLLLSSIAARPSGAFSAVSVSSSSRNELHGSSLGRISSALGVTTLESAITNEPVSNFSISALRVVEEADVSVAALTPRITRAIDMFDGEACVKAGVVEYCPVDKDAPQLQPKFMDSILSTYVGPRAILAMSAILYGTNFPLGAIMNDNLPASAATSGRMVLASIVLSPFLLQLKPSIRNEVFIGGAFVSLGYISQSIALSDTSPALVSFLGAATVVVCPILQWAVDKKPMSIKDAPQTWLAAFLCVLGVAALELAGPSAADASGAVSLSHMGAGDALSLIQAAGFGAGIFMSEKMMKKEPDQAIQITAGMVATTAFFSMVWCFSDGWMREPGWESIGLPGLFLDQDMRTVALAVAWTGILSTSANFCMEITALGRVPSAEASVILATEPLWASLFAALWFHEEFGTSDYIGGMLMISACLVNTLDPAFMKGIFSRTNRLSE